MTPPALLRFGSGRATLRLFMVLLGWFGIAAGCSVDSGAVAPSSAESALHEAGPQAGTPEEFPRNRDMPHARDFRGEPYRPPSFTPHWSAPTLAMLFRRAPGTLPGDGGETAPGDPADETPNDATAGMDDGDNLPETQLPPPDTPAPRRGPGVAVPHDFHVIEPYLEGVASWYGPGFHGKDTANGEVYNQNDLTAAHPTLPLGTVIKVRNLVNNRVVWVRVNDRGPYAKGRILDLSKAAARRLDMLKEGTAPVSIKVLRWPTGFHPPTGLRPYTQYVVQVAAYPNPETAETELVRLQQRFPWADFLLDWRQGGRLSVVAGPYDSKPEAQHVARRLQQNGVTSLTRRYRK